MRNWPPRQEIGILQQDPQPLRIGEVGRQIADPIEFEPALRLVQGNAIRALVPVIEDPSRQDGATDRGSVAVKAGLLVEADTGDDGRPCSSPRAA